MVKVGLENIITSYFQITEAFKLLLSIRQQAEVKMTERPGGPGSKYDMQPKKSKSQWKTFHIRKPKKNNKFLVYLAILEPRNNFGNLLRTFYLCLTSFQKQPPRGVLRKRCSENVQQIYRRIPMPKCDFNKVAKELSQLSAVKELLQKSSIDKITTDGFFISRVSLHCFSSLFKR